MKTEIAQTISEKVKNLPIAEQEKVLEFVEKKIIRIATKKNGSI